MAKQEHEPTGRCWYCGDTVGPKSFFCAGHDRAAEAAIIKSEYGSIAGFVVAHGYGPDGERDFTTLAIHEHERPLRQVALDLGVRGVGARVTLGASASVQTQAIQEVEQEVISRSPVEEVVASIAGEGEPPTT